MPRSTTQFAVGTAIAIVLAVVGVSAIGNAGAQSTIEQAKTLINRQELPSLQTDFRLSDHQQLRRIFLDGNRLR